MTFSGDFDPAAVYHKVKSYLEAMGFSLNEKKTKLLKDGVRPVSYTHLHVSDIGKQGLQ